MTLATRTEYANADETTRDRYLTHLAALLLRTAAIRLVNDPGPIIDLGVAVDTLQTFDGVLETGGFAKLIEHMNAYNELMNQRYGHLDGLNLADVSTVAATENAMLHIGTSVLIETVNHYVPVPHVRAAFDALTGDDPTAEETAMRQMRTISAAPNN
jgi:hypothetical protein